MGSDADFYGTVRLGAHKTTSLGFRPAGRAIKMYHSRLKCHLSYVVCKNLCDSFIKLVLSQLRVTLRGFS